MVLHLWHLHWSLLLIMQEWLRKRAWNRRVVGLNLRPDGITFIFIGYIDHIFLRVRAPDLLISTPTPKPLSYHVLQRTNFPDHFAVCVTNNRSHFTVWVFEWFSHAQIHQSRHRCLRRLFPLNCCIGLRLLHEPASLTLSNNSEKSTSKTKERESVWVYMYSIRYVHVCMLGGECPQGWLKLWTGT